jgi:hypothetical protein
LSSAAQSALQPEVKCLQPQVKPGLRSLPKLALCTERPARAGAWISLNPKFVRTYRETGIATAAPQRSSFRTYPDRFGEITMQIKTIAAITFMFALSPFNHAATFTVRSTAPGSTGSCAATCTLQDALDAATTSPALDTIAFNVAGVGPHEFNFPTTVTNPIVLDGYTQPGSTLNSLNQGTNAVLKIRLFKRLEFTPSALGSSVRGVEFVNLDAPGTGSLSILNTANQLSVLGCKFAGRNTSISSFNKILIGSSTNVDRNAFFGQRSISLSAGTISGITMSASNSLILNNVFGRSEDLASVVTIGDAIQIIAGNNIQIGGVGPSEGNVFSGATVNGAVFFSGGSTGVRIRGNRFTGNTSRPIALITTFPVPNDLDDVDTGPNGLQNFPVLTAINQRPGGFTRFAGTLDRPATADSRIYDIDFYLSATCHASGRGEGDAFFRTLAFTSTGPADETFSTAFVGAGLPAGSVVTAIATERATGNSSEFSACLVAP